MSICHMIKVVTVRQMNFADQLSVIEGINSTNLDYQVVIGGDFNVDLSHKWIHTAMVCYAG